MNDLNDDIILNLWKNKYYNGKLTNINHIVNLFLRNKKIEDVLKNNIMRIFNLSCEKDFNDFIKYYIGRLTKIIYKNASNKSKILYGGECIKKFNKKEGDIIKFKKFQSLTDNIYSAYEFSKDVDNKCNRILFVIHMPSGSMYKKTTNNKEVYNMEHNVIISTEYREYIIIPQSEYKIIDISNYDNFKIVKLVLIKQIDIKFDIVKSIEDKNLTELKKDIEKNKQLINSLNKMEKYKVNNQIYELLLTNIDNYYNINNPEIVKIINDINKKNIIEKTDKLKEYGIEIDEFSVYFDQSSYIKELKTFKKLQELKFKKYNGKLYTGFYNINKDMDKPKFIELLNNKKKGEFNEIIQSRLTKDYYIYDDIDNKMMQTSTIKKDTESILQYYKYIVELKLNNVKICVANDINNSNQKFILIIPPIKYNFLNKTEFYNKHNQKCYKYVVEIN